MKYAIVSGSHRSNSQSEKVAAYIKGRIEEFSSTNTASVISLAGNPLPLWDAEVWEQTDRWKELWGPISQQLADAEAMVFVVPEWGGMVPPALKNMILLGALELAHKPALIVSVTSGLGGSNPISELRMSGYKNCRVCYLPEHVIVRNVEKVFGSDVINLDLHEDKLRDRLDHNLKLLGLYGLALNQVRSTEEINVHRYPYGM